MILIDKGYYDYDYEKTEHAKPAIDWKDTVKSDEEVRNLMAGFGIGVPQTTEEIQNHIIKEEQKNGSRNTGSN